MPTVGFIYQFFERTDVLNMRKSKNRGLLVIFSIIFGVILQKAAQAVKDEQNPGTTMRSRSQGKHQLTQFLGDPIETAGVLCFVCRQVFNL